MTGVCRACRSRLGRNLLDLSFQLLHIATDNSSNLLAILEQYEGGHSVNAVFNRSTLQLIHIHRNKTNIQELFTELAESGSDSLAGSTPGRKKVDNDETGGDEGFEDDLAV